MAGVLGAPVWAVAPVGAAIVALLGTVWYFRDEIGQVLGDVIFKFWELATAIPDALSTAWEGIKGFFSGFLGAAKSAINAVIGVVEDGSTPWWAGRTWSSTG